MKFKKTIFIILALICVSVSCFGCENSGKNKKYDVRIRLKRNLGGSITFDVGEDEKRYTFEYTGEGMKFWVDSYNLPDHPRWHYEWFEAPGTGPNTFNMSMLYRVPGGDYVVSEDPLKERGEYIIRIEALPTSDIWKARVVRLYITIE